MPPTASATQAHRPPPQDDPARRGRLIVSVKTVEKTASQLLLDMPGVGGRDRGLLGLGGSGDLSDRPAVQVELAGRIAVLRVEVGLEYPAPMRTLTEDIRVRLASELARLTGVEVRQVDIEVVWLRGISEPGAKRRLL